MTLKAHAKDLADNADMPLVTPAKLGRVAVSVFTNSSGTGNWTLGLRLNGSGSDTATFSFEVGRTIGVHVADASDRRSEPAARGHWSDRVEDPEVAT